MKHREPKLRPTVSGNDSDASDGDNRSRSVGRFVTTDFEGYRATRQTAYYLTVAVIGVFLLIRLFLNNPLPDPSSAALLLFLGIILSHFAVALPSKVHLLQGLPLVMGALYSKGIVAGALVIIPSTLLHFFTHKRGLCNCLFNAGQLTISLYVSAALGKLAGWTPGIPATSKDLIPIMLMLAGRDFANILLVVGAKIVAESASVELIGATFYRDRKTIMAQETFTSVASMLLASYMGNIAYGLVFIGILASKAQYRFQGELSVKTQQAETDPLTKAHNMRYLENWLDDEFKELARNKKECSVIFLDADCLKTVNDTYSHRAGDLLLLHMAKLISSNVRAKDRIVRYGGDEFLVICPNTNLAQSESIAKRIQQAAQSCPFVYNKISIAYNMSIGVATWPEHGETGPDIIRMADKAMYLSKSKGGNTVQTASNLLQATTTQ